MRFRPCIDIHNGKVKQIVWGSLRDVQDQAEENFVSGQDAAFYAELYKEKGLKGGHVILLNSGDSPYFPATKEQALLALKAYHRCWVRVRDIAMVKGGKRLPKGASFSEEITTHEHLLLLLSDAFQQYLCWFIIWILRNKFATDSKIKYFLS